MKIFKLFVCLLLILSISLVNSFAAISVSDGSAFVTKAEFAADLNNLSNRMSSLENSLDAKIDSLVSSYLSRNGIWNGEKQITDKVYLNTRKGISTSVSLKTTTATDPYSPSVKYGEIVDSGIVFSKAGLVCLTYNYTPNTYFKPNGDLVKESDNSSSYEYLEYSSISGSKNGFFPLTTYISFNLYLADKNGSAYNNQQQCLTVTLATLGGLNFLNYDTSNNAYGFYSNSFSSNSVYFFTSKDKSLIGKFYLYYKIGSSNLSIANISYKRTSNIPAFIIEECLVY